MADMTPEQMADKLREWADDDVMETARDGTFEYNDAVIWAQMMRDAAAELQRLSAALAERDERVRVLHHHLSVLTNSKAILGVRGLVAGWNGENLPEPYKTRHPYNRRASLPDTCCGEIYKLDEAITAARAALTDTQ